VLIPEQIRNDVARLNSQEEIVVYVFSRVKEFETLRTIYERDIQTFKDIAKQAGENADKFIHTQLNSQLNVRNSWWKEALEKASGIQIQTSAFRLPADIEKATEDFMAVVVERFEDVKKYREQRSAIDVEGQAKQLGDGL